MEEKIEIYDSDLRLIGISDYDEVHRLGYWHKVIHCWVFDSATGLLLYQKRAKSKTIYPGFLDVSVAGHCRIGEGLYETIDREAMEEIGIKVDPNRLQKIGLRKENLSDATQVNREFQYVFLYETRLRPDRIRIDRSELDYVVLIRPEDVIRSLETRATIEGILFLNGFAVNIGVSYKEFIPSVDDYNLMIPQIVNQCMANRDYGMIK